MTIAKEIKASLPEGDRGNSIVLDAEKIIEIRYVPGGTTYYCKDGSYLYIDEDVGWLVTGMFCRDGVNKIHVPD